MYRYLRQKQDNFIEMKYIKNVLLLVLKVQYFDTNRVNHGKMKIQLAPKENLP